MHIAVIGSGISGLASAWLLSRGHHVVLYEAQSRLGGHTHTHRVTMDGTTYAVDSGFIIYNTRHYPLLTRLFAELGIVSQASTMSFAVRNERSGLEYNAANLNGLFCQRRNLVSPRFLGMVRDLLRFYREAPAVLADDRLDLTLEEYLVDQRYGDAFIADHLIPMGSALWSCPSADVLAFPVRHFVQFMVNHQMLQVADRPGWQVVQGGSSQYVAALRARWSVDERAGLPVRQVRRFQSHVEVKTDSGAERFDHLVMACHSDQALTLLADASFQERDILSAIRYQANDVMLHSDSSVLPSRRRLWAAWNVLVSNRAGSPYVVSYCMNRLQRLTSPQPLIVTLNGEGSVDADRLIERMRYEHPVFSRAAVAAQRRKDDIQGTRRTWYAGAYWGWGFHEDGMRSAVAIAHAFGIDWPYPGSATTDRFVCETRAA
jgi:uncharacterized protein